MTSSITELVGTIAKLAPNLGVISRLEKSITEVIFELDDYRPGSRGVDEGDSSGFAMYQSKMMSSTNDTWTLLFGSHCLCNQIIQ